MVNNNNNKGNGFELECKKQLESLGYVVIKSPRTMRCIGKGRWVSSDCDYFNLYDLCAKKKNDTRWIQCKYGSLSNVSMAKVAIMMFHDAYMSKYESSEIWFRGVGERLIYKYVYDEDSKEFIKE